jgi:hypothetical protein
MSILEQHTALYTMRDIAYAQCLSGPYANFCKEEPGAVLIAGEKNGRTTGFWRPMVCFGPDDFQEGSIESVWAWCRDILYEDYLIDGTLSPISRFLLGKGYVATPHYTQVVDLRKSVEKLRHDLRKSYRSLVNKSAEKIVAKQFQSIHERVKGKTRSIASWIIQFGMDTVCYANPEKTAGVMFYAGPVWSYYASAAGDNTHAAIWSALMELKRRGVQFCEMGTQEWGEGKMASIARYKSGFGGSTKVRLILRKP